MDSLHKKLQFAWNNRYWEDSVFYTKVLLASMPNIHVNHNSHNKFGVYLYIRVEETICYCFCRSNLLFLRPFVITPRVPILVLTKKKSLKESDYFWLFCSSTFIFTFSFNTYLVYFVYFAEWNLRISDQSTKEADYNENAVCTMNLEICTSLTS